VRNSAGLLPYRETASVLEVLLVHPGGPFWAKKDEGAWSIPKGEIGDGEDPLAAAMREFTEETGFIPEGDFLALKPIVQPGGKRVQAWAMRANFDAVRLHSNLFSMEWPPRSGRQRQFPEVDRAAWFDIGTARVKILKAQMPLLDDLMAQMAKAR